MTFVSNYNNLLFTDMAYIVNKIIRDDAEEYIYMTVNEQFTAIHNEVIEVMSKHKRLKELTGEYKERIANEITSAIISINSDGYYI